MDSEHDRPLATYRGFRIRIPSEPPQHLPAQPSWSCADCGEQWPCAPAREQLKAENDSVQLAILMWTYLEDYARDAGEGPFSGAFERFILWTR